MSSRVTLLPSARRLMDSLREIGYDLPSAVADIVDNSIAAKAKRVELTFAFDGADSWIRITDDGIGMTGAALEEAMRYGTERTYEPGELGRFGLGLKTASLSQCRRLTVASRRGRERCRIEIRRWSLDHVARTNRWEVLRIHPMEAPPELIDSLIEHPGTVVLWEGLDRVLDYRLPDGAAARRGFDTLAADTAGHIAMVFHRFLAGEARGRRPLTVALNESVICAWDPYARSEPHTRQLAPQRVRLSPDGSAAALLVRPYLLPPQERFSSVAAHALTAGPQRWNRQQGFYFYRGDRLIQAGGWSRLRTLDEHTKLARVAIDLPPGSDELFSVNVAKMRVSIPSTLRGPLTAIASGVVAEAGARYRIRLGSSHNGSTRPMRDHSAPAPMVSVLQHHERDLLRLIIAVAREEFREEPDVLRRLLSRIERLPASAPPTVDLAGIPVPREGSGSALKS
ncbi:MAG: ATP-binding protein [Candidatus Dormibacteria bacterium]